MRRSTGCAAGLVSSQPAIPCVVTRDGPELYTRGDRSSNFIGPVPRSPGRGPLEAKSRDPAEAHSLDGADR